MLPRIFAIAASGFATAFVAIAFTYRREVARTSSRMRPEFDRANAHHNPNWRTLPCCRIHAFMGRRAGVVPRFGDIGGTLPALPLETRNQGKRPFRTVAARAMNRRKSAGFRRSVFLEWPLSSNSGNRHCTWLMPMPAQTGNWRCRYRACIISSGTDPSTRSPPPAGWLSVGSLVAAHT